MKLVQWGGTHDTATLLYMTLVQYDMVGCTLGTVIAGCVEDSGLFQYDIGIFIFIRVVHLTQLNC